MQTDTTRRSFLKAAPVAALAVTLPAAAIAAPTDRRAWDFAMACYQRIKAEDAAFSGPYLAVWERCKEACEQVPHVTLRPDPYTGHREPVSTADRFYVERARREVASLDAGKMRFDPIPDLQEHEKLLRDVVQAADERDATIQAIRDRFGMDEADEQSEALGDRECDASGKLLAMPAPDLAALRWKLDYLSDGLDAFASYDPSFTAQTMADIARLLPEGR